MPHGVDIGGIVSKKARVPWGEFFEKFGSAFRAGQQREQQKQQRLSELDKLQTFSLAKIEKQTTEEEKRTKTDLKLKKDRAVATVANFIEKAKKEGTRYVESTGATGLPTARGLTPTEIAREEYYKTATKSNVAKDKTVTFLNKERDKRMKVAKEIWARSEVPWIQWGDSTQIRKSDRTAYEKAMKEIELLDAKLDKLTGSTLGLTGEVIGAFPGAATVPTQGQ